MEKMYEVENIKRLHIELSSRCNASCPCCSRNYSGGPMVPELELTELSLADIKRMIPPEIAKNLTEINFCGNVGDPGMAIDLIPILEYFREQSPGVVQQVRTNGGMRNEKFWTELGKFFSQQPVGDSVYRMSGAVFGVDGLEDTNHIYRRGVIWEKLIRNMKAYSATGAFAIWEWLLFDHNAHQVDEARALANELGFELVLKNPLGFEGRPYIPAYSESGELEYTIWPVNGDKSTEVKLPQKLDFTEIHNNRTVPELTDNSRKLVADSGITCKSIVRETSKEIYISANGYMLPCCFLGGIFGNFSTNYSRYQFNKLINDYGLDKFDLKKHSIIDIVNGSEFSDFFLDSWNKETIEGGKMLYCVEVCGNDSVIDRIYDKKDYIKIHDERTYNA